MKRITIIIAALALICSQAQAQSFLDKIKQKAESTIGGSLGETMQGMIPEGMSQMAGQDNDDPNSVNVVTGEQALPAKRASTFGWDGPVTPSSAKFPIPLMNEFPAVPSAQALINPVEANQIAYYKAIKAVTLRAEELKYLACRSIGDYAITYQVKLGRIVDPINPTAFVTKQHLKDWGIKEEDLYRDAMAADAKREFGLYDVMEFLKDPFSLEISTENFLNGKTIADCTSPVPFFILTYKDRSLGASLMAHSDVLEKIGDVFGENYLLVPSSIHELLIGRDDEGAAEFHTKACRDGNSQYVLPSEVLSDKVLRYDIKYKTLTNAIDGHGNINMGNKVRTLAEENKTRKRKGR